MGRWRGAVKVGDGTGREGRCRGGSGREAITEGEVERGSRGFLEKGAERAKILLV